MTWICTEAVETRQYGCGHCGSLVASEKGWNGPGTMALSNVIRICPQCDKPTFMLKDFGKIEQQIPGPKAGGEVKSLPVDLHQLYAESRQCVTDNSNTAAVLILRKMLMNVAVDQGADENQTFQQYVNYLSKENWIPPNGKQWVDHIRKKGNEATHEIKVMEPEDAKELLNFMELLLRFAYEFPQMAPAPNPPNAEA